MKHFPSAFFPPVLWTTAGISTAPLLGLGEKKMAGVTANGISGMRFGIFFFMRQARLLSGCAAEESGMSFCQASAETPSR